MVKLNILLFSEHGVAMFYRGIVNFVAYNCSLCLNHDQSRISQCAQCARSREAPTTLEAPPPGKRENNSHANVCH